MTMFGNAIGLSPGNLGMTLFKPSAGFVPVDVPQAEADALIALYNATDGPNWTDDTNWLIDTTVGNWFGVTVAGGHVTRLDLRNNGLDGEGLSTLAPLTLLTRLYLYNTNVNGDIADIATLTLLTHLYLQNTNVNGNVADIATLTLLTHLHLAITNVNGNIADIATLTLLEYLYLYGTIVSGDIADIATLTSLTTLYLYDTGIVQGTIGTMVAMRDCRVQDCGWAEAAVDAFLANMYTSRASFTYATPALNISGNDAPSGIYQAMCPPTTGKEYAYELENDSCGDGFNKWDVTFTP
jgi:hypothetical protein